jgi:uncharacterized protein
MKLRSVCLVALTTAMSFNVFATATPDAAHIYVKGEATITTMPDHVVLQVGITEVGTDLIAAKNNTDKTMAKAIKIVKALGISDADINAGQISINRENQYNRESGQSEFKGFRVARSLMVKLAEIDKYPELLQNLVNNGINEINHTRFLASNYDALYKQAQQLAIKDSRNAAQEFSQAYGVALKGLYSASMQPLDVQSAPYMRAEKVMLSAEAPSNYVPDAYHAGEITITASSYAVYYIE